MRSLNHHYTVDEFGNNEDEEENPLKSAVEGKCHFLVKVCEFNQLFVYHPEEEDVQVQDIQTKRHREDKTRDVAAFFGDVQVVNKGGHSQHVRECEVCK